MSKTPTPGAHRLAALSLALLAAGAAAQEGQALQWRASLGATRDSNLLRLPAAANVAAVAGQPSAADTITTGTLGAVFDKTYGLQGVKASVSAVSQRFDRFDYLDNSALNYSAAWNWAATPRLKGVLSSSRNRSLNNLADVSNVGQRNERTVQAERFEAEYGIRGPWGAVFGLGRSSTTNSQPTLAETDFSSTSANAGLQYNFPSGSVMAARLRGAEGDYVNRSASLASLFDNRFFERGAEVSLRWLLSGKSSASLNLARFSRTHPNTPQRDYSGTTGGASFAWAASGKFGLQAAWARDLATFQAADANFVVTQRITLSPTWQPGPRTQLQFNLQRALRRYGGEPFGPLPAGIAARSDSSTDWGLNFSWRPDRAWLFSASLQRVQRDANRANLDYRANIASASLQFSY